MYVHTAEHRRPFTHQIESKEKADIKKGQSQRKMVILKYNKIYKLLLYISQLI